MEKQDKKKAEIEIIDSENARTSRPVPEKRKTIRRNKNRDLVIIISCIIAAALVAVIIVFLTNPYLNGSRRDPSTIVPKESESASSTHVSDASEVSTGNYGAIDYYFSVESDPASDTIQNGKSYYIYKNKEEAETALNKTREYFDGLEESGVSSIEKDINIVIITWTAEYIKNQFGTESAKEVKNLIQIMNDIRSQNN